MAGVLDLLFVMGGLLLILSIGGVIANLVDRIPLIRLLFNRFYKTLPLGRKEVQELSQERHSCRY